MPIFEYRCKSCHARFEVLEARADDAAARCPRCGDADVARQLSVFAVSSSRDASPPGPCGSSDCACRKP